MEGKIKRERRIKREREKDKKEKGHLQSIPAE